MYYYLVAVATLAHSKSASFTYHHLTPLNLGTLVRVPVGKKVYTGVVTQSTKKPSFTTKGIDEVIEAPILPPQLLQLADWLSEYYVSHLGLVWQTILPSGLHKKRRNSTSQQTLPRRAVKEIFTTPPQRSAIDAINAASQGGFLLKGVPGSGKTHVYIEACKHAISQGKSSIILVPEIALTAQLIAEFKQHFSHVFVTHSTMTEAERHKVWHAVATSTKPVIVIGPRSAIFSPIANLGLIIIDECHEQTFKQDRAPRYNTLYVAARLASLHRAKFVLGSATPNVTELFLANENKLTLLTLDSPVNKRSNNVHVVNRTEKSAFSRHRFFSNQLIDAIDTSLSKGEQALIFHNRRGTAPSIVCESCGWQALCPTCDLPLTYHNDKRELRCHTCGHAEAVTHTCHACYSPTIIFKGIGTKLIEQELNKLFPKARIARFDADNDKEEQLQERYQEIYDRNVDILVGTQIIAKGLDIPGISTVGVLQADAGLQLPDYTAYERTFQLLYQVAGRAGRTGIEGTTVLQTYLPNDTLFNYITANNFDDFSKKELKDREKLRYPPYYFLLKLTVSAKTESTAIKNATAAAKTIRNNYRGCIVLGPAPAFREKLVGQYHWQIIIKSKRRKRLEQIAKDFAPQQKWQVDIDPLTLL